MKDAEANYETSQTSKIELLARIIIGFQRCLTGVLTTPLKYNKNA